MRQQRDDEVRTSLVPERSEDKTIVMKQQYLPFTILKRLNIKAISLFAFTVVIAIPFTVLEHLTGCKYSTAFSIRLQQYLPFTVCAEGCETAEAQSDDEVRTSQVPERSEGKTKVIRDSAYRLRY